MKGQISHVTHNLYLKFVLKKCMRHNTQLPFLEKGKPILNFLVDMCPWLGNEAKIFFET